MYSAGIGLIARHFSCEMIFILHAQFLAELLQFTVSASDAGQAFLVMHRQKKFQRPFPRFDQFLRIGQNFHAFRYRIDTGSHQISCAFYLYHAHAAGADFIDFF